MRKENQVDFSVSDCRIFGASVECHGEIEAAGSPE